MLAPVVGPLAQLGRRLGSAGRAGSGLLSSARRLLPSAGKDKQQ